MNMKKYLNCCFNKPFFFCLLLILCGFLSVLIIGNSLLSIRELSRTNYASSVDMIDQRMNSIIYEINNFPRYAGNDMVFLSGLSTLKSTDIPALKQDFLAFLRENTAYYQLAYVDIKGTSQVSVEFDGKNYRVMANGTPSEFDGDWFQKTKELKKGDVFISPIELHKNGGQWENRGTAQKPVYVPVITYATPIYSDDGVKKGAIVSAVYTDYFLADIRAFQRKGETVFLVDNQGHYLAHPDQTREFAYLFGRDDSLQKDYPEVARKILSVSRNRVIESGDKVFSFRYLYPTTGSFSLYKGAQALHDSANSYFWVMVSVTDKKELQSASRELISGEVIFALLTLALTAGLAGIGYALKRSKEA